MNEIKFITDWLRRNAALYPQLPALIDRHGTSTHTELLHDVTALLNQISSLGVSPGGVIASYCSSRRLLIGLSYASPLLGCAFQPLNPVLPHKIVNSLLTSTGARYLIAEEMADNFLLSIINVQALDVNINHLSVISNQHSKHTLELDATQLIIATSGSEGEPKAVMLTGRNIIAAATASRQRICLEPTDRWLLCLPLYHIGGSAIIHRCTQAGAAVVIADNFSGEAIAEALEQYSCTHVSLVPAMLARLLNVGIRPPSMLRYVLIGGAALNPALAQSALAQGWPLCISYGMSEACSQVATLCNPLPNWFGQLVGKPLPGMQVRIGNTTGRIYLRGDAVMSGYANPEQILGNGIGADGWFETADLGYMDVTEQLWVLGRADQVLISGGVKIHPAQVESLLQPCPGIDEIAIGGKLDPIWGELIVAVIAGSAHPEQVKTWCREHVPKTMRPRVFIKIAQLPRTNLGKIDQIALRTIIKASD